MGLFNFIYKLTNILSNKKKMRIFFIIAIVLILLFCWTRGSFAATAEEANALTNYQLVLQESAISYLRMLWKSNNVPTTTYNNLINLMKSYNIYVTTSQNDNAQFIIYLYLNNVDGNRHYNDINSFTLDGEWSLGILPDGTPSGTQFPCKIAQFEGYSFVLYRFGVQGQDTIVNYNFGNFYLPDACWMVRSHTINEFLQENGIYSEVMPTYSTHDSELQSVVSSGFTNQVNAVNNLNSSVEDVNSSVEDVNQSVMDMIDTIVDPYVNVTAQQLPENNVQDPTTDGLNSLFIMIKDAFTGTPESVSFPIPFTNDSFTIDPRFY